jgi:Ras-related protein Rab-8A
MMIFSSMVIQPQTIKINQQDQAANGGQAAPKSACCG